MHETKDITVWERLRVNRELNAPVFLKANCRPELARQVECQSCGDQEMALFWTLVAQNGRILDLRCPLCDQGTAQYDLSGDKPSSYGRVVAMFGAGALLLTIGTVLLARESGWASGESAPAWVMEVYDAGADRAADAAEAVWSRLPANVQGAWSPPRRAARPRTGSEAPREAPAQAAGGTRGGTAASPGGRAPSTSTTRSGAVAPQPRSTLAEAQRADSPEATPSGLLVYAARGDRRGELDGHAARIIERSGEEEARLLVQLVYDAGRDETRASVNAGSTDWPRTLTRLRGWRRVQE